MGAGASVPATEPALSDTGKAALLTYLEASGLRYLVCVLLLIVVLLQVFRFSSFVFHINQPTSRRLGCCVATRLTLRRGERGGGVGGVVFPVEPVFSPHQHPGHPVSVLVLHLCKYLSVRALCVVKNKNKQQNVPYETTIRGKYRRFSIIFQPKKCHAVRTGNENKQNIYTSTACFRLW